MMESVHVTAIVFGLLSVGRAAPVSTCESLLQPLELPGRYKLLGYWMHIGESTNVPGSAVITKTFVESVWSNITAADQMNGTINFQNQKMLGVCLSVSYNMTVENNKLVMVQPYPATAVLLTTSCPDCMLLYSNNTIGRNSYVGLQLLSRRRKVSAAELEEYKRQVECLNLPPPTIMDPEKGLCPDPSVSLETTDLTSRIRSDDMTLLEKILSSEKRLSAIIQMLSTLSSNAPKMMQN